MMAIVGEAVVSCYVLAASLLVMIVLLLLSWRTRRKDSTSDRDFLVLCVCVVCNCVLSFAYNALYGHTAPWCRAAALIAKTLRDTAVMLTAGLWLVYVYHKLYGKRKTRHPVRVGMAFIPFAVLPVLLIVNLFTGAVFDFSPDNRLRAKPLMYIMYGVEFIYFCSSAVIVRQYDRRTRKIRFLRISPLILSVFLTSATHLFTSYDIGPLGHAAGMALLYFSLIGEYRFVDEESGLYNSGYMAFLFDIAVAGKNDTHSALILETEGHTASAFAILRDTLHRDGDVIRAEENKFLLFSGETSRSTLQYLISLVDEAAEKHNAEFPEKKVRFTARCRMRDMAEDAFTFMRTVMNDREVGDEMKGIASMISELDRLDKELQLAADIQISMLPTVFPAFPDRTEFDLYASMVPAKEVGGDFYDFFLVDADHLALVIADVSGKGIPAALFMMMSKGLIRNMLMTGCGPAAALERVNQQLCERNSSMMFVTVWAAVVELSTGRGTACNAGHENPALRRAGGDFEMLKYRHSMFLGVNKKAVYENRGFVLAPGDCVFVYTDGVPEASDADSGMFGEGRLTAALNADPDAPPEELIGRMHAEVNRFVGDAPRFDDITMLCVKYRGLSAPARQPR